MARKDVNSYFSHDSNARNDDKIIRLRMKHGASGYGVYFMILERLREETDYVSVKDYNIIAFDFRVDASLVKSVVEDFGLFVFTEDGKGFYSESLLRRMEIKDTVRNKRKDAAAARWSKKPDNISSGNKPKDKPQPSKEKTVPPSPTLCNAKTSEPKTAPQPVVASVPSTPTVQKYSLSIDDEVTEMKKSTLWKESVCIRYQLSNEQVDACLADFALKCDKQHTSLQDAKSHFCYWLQKQKKDESQPSARGLNEPQPSARGGHSPQPMPPANDEYQFNGGFGGVDI